MVAVEAFVESVRKIQKSAVIYNHAMYDEALDKLFDIIIDYEKAIAREAAKDKTIIEDRGFAYLSELNKKQNKAAADEIDLEIC